MKIIKIIYNDSQKRELILNAHRLQSVDIENGNYQGVYNKCWIKFSLIGETVYLNKIPERVARNTYRDLIDLLSDDCGSIVITLLRADGENVTDIFIKKL